MISFKAPWRGALPGTLVSPTTTPELSIFYKTKGSLLCSKQSTYCLYPQPEESSLRHPTLVLYNQFQIILPSTPRFQGVPSGFSTSILAFFSCLNGICCYSTMLAHRMCAILKASYQGNHE
jgi:hypothetical protein